MLASLCAVLAALALGSATALASPPSHTQTIDSPNSLNAVSCVPQSTDCVVSDSKGNALYSSDVSVTGAATWTSWTGPAGTEPSEAVACPSASLCAIAAGHAETLGTGGSLYYATSLGGAWQVAREPTYGTDAISCASTSLCVSAQAEGYIVETTRPASEEWFPVELGLSAIKAVDCVSSSFCAAVDSNGNVYIANTEAQIKESIRRDLGGGSSGGWTSTDVDGTSALHGIACTSRTSCFAVDGEGNLLDLTINGSGEATVSKHDIDGTNDLTAIACTGFSCATVDNRGNVFVSGNGGVSWSRELETGTDLTSVSCASSALCVTADTTGNVTAFTAPSSAYGLSVFVTGEGRVESSPAGIVCEAEECSHQFEGAVTLTATPKPDSGYVFAGWLGCKHAEADTCEIATPTSEVTAVFVEQGTEGREGKEGSAGREGASGRVGPAGVAGQTGSPGPAGRPGKKGPAGKVELVTCTKVGRKQKCTAKLVSGTVKFTAGAARARLSRHGVVYAAGTARRLRGRMSLRLIAVRSLRPGRYTLTLTTGSGRHESIQTEPFMFTG
jgi:hypothetical protein